MMKIEYEVLTDFIVMVLFTRCIEVSSWSPHERYAPCADRMLKNDYNRSNDPRFEEECDYGLELRLTVKSKNLKNR